MEFEFLESKSMKRIFTLVTSIFLFSYWSQAQTTPASSIVISPVSASGTSLRFDWTSGTGDAGRIVVITTGGSTWSPVTGTPYTATLAFPSDATTGTGPDFDNTSGGIAAVVYKGTGNGNVVVTGLSETVSYTITVYEYNTAGTTYIFTTSQDNPVTFEYKTSGGATANWWTAPTGVHGAIVQAWGGGGGGGGGANGGSGNGNAVTAGGGAGGSYAEGVATVTPATQYGITLGSGGSGGANSGATGGTGGDTFWAGNAIVARGGVGGGGATTTTTPGTKGLGSASATSVGSIVTSVGGNGGDAAGGPPGAYSGGGGSSGSSISGAGNDASTSNQNKGTEAGAGDGANGRTGDNNGSTGSAPGGGGSGAFDANNGATGGPGGKGMLIVSYTRPTAQAIARMTPSSQYASGSTVTFQVTFSEPVSNVTSAGFTLTGAAATAGPATIGTIGGSGGVYTVQVNGIKTDGTGDGTLTLALSGTTITSAATGNLILTGAGVTTASQSYTMDNTKPVVTLTVPVAGTSVKTNSITYSLTESNSITSGTVTWAENGTSLDGTHNQTMAAGDLTTGTHAGTFSNNPTLVDGAIYDVSVSVTDIAGNTSVLVKNATVKYDITKPNVTINPHTSATSGTLPVVFDVVFSEPINTGTISTSSFSVGGTAGGSASGLVDTGDHMTFTLSCTASGTGTIIPSIAAGTVQDLAGNTNTISTGSNTITYNPSPSVSISSAITQPTSANSVTFTALFSAPIDGATFDHTDIVLGGTSVGATHLTDPTNPSLDNKTWIITVNTSVITTDGTLSVSIPAAAVKDITDALDNLASTNGANNPITIDKTPPTISMATSSPTTSGGVIGINGTITFTVVLAAAETPTAATITPTSYNGGTLVWNSSDGQTYTAVYTAITSGQTDQTSPVNLTITATDAAGNASTTATATVFETIDVTPPAATTVTVAATGGTSLVPTYYNGTNTGVAVNVTIPSDNSLINGTYEIWINDQNNTTAAYKLASATSISAVSTTIPVSYTQAALNSSGKFTDGSTSYFYAVLIDIGGNSTPGTISGLMVDLTPPATNTVGTIAATGNRTVAGYYNLTNTGLNVPVPMSTSDGSLDGGKILIKVQNTGNAGYVPIGGSGAGSGTYTITNSDRTTGSVTINVNKVNLEGAVSSPQGFAEGVHSGLASAESSFMQISVDVVDIAGNTNTTPYTGSSTVDVDLTAPTIATGPFYYKDPAALGTGNQDEVVQLTLNEDISLSSGTALLTTNVNTTTPGFYLNGDIDIGGKCLYLNTGATNSIDASLTNTRLLYLESSTATSGWTTSTPLAYTQQTSYPGSGNFIMDPAGNELGAFSTAPSAGASTNLGVATSTVLATGTYTSGQTGKTLFAFSLQNTGGSAVTLSSLHIISSADVTNLLSNIKLFTNTTDAGPSTNLSLTPTLVTSAPFGINYTPGLSLAAGSTTYFYLVADIKSFFYANNPTLYFSIAASSLPNVGGGYKVTGGGYGGADQAQAASYFTFSDVTAPVISSISNTATTVSTTMGSPSLLMQTVTVVYNEPMDPSTKPTITFSNGAGWGLQSAIGWSKTTYTNDTYTATFTHNATSESFPSVTSKVAINGGAKDWGGNQNLVAGSSSPSTFILDTTPPTGTVAVSPTTISTVATDLLVTVTYSEPMNTGVNPNTNFSASGGNFNVQVAGAWSSSTVYKITYRHIVTVHETTPGVTVTASNAKDANGNSQVVTTPNSNSFNIDTDLPTVNFINRTTSTPTNATSLTYQVIFSESVLNVGTGNFSAVAGAPVTTAGVTTISGSATTYNLTVGTVNATAGNGTVELDLSTIGSITDGAGNPLANTFNGTSGVYTVDQIAPTGQSIVISSTLKNIGNTNGIVASSVDFLVTFNETDLPLSGIDANGADFTVSTDGNVAWTTISANYIAGNTCTVTVGGITGTGRISVGLLNDNSIEDNAGNILANSIATSFTGSQYYTMVLPEPYIDAAFAVSAPTATVTSTSITVTWNENATAQTPTNYLVLASTTTPTAPSDANAVPDGALAQNIPYGTNTATFSNLISGTVYNFAVYKYTLPGNVTTDNIDFELTKPAILSTQSTVASFGTLKLNSTPISISSIKNDNTNSANVLIFTINDDDWTPIISDVITFHPNLLAQESITINLGEELTLGEGAAVTGFSSPTNPGTIATAIYSGKGTTNIITLTSAANGQWTASTKISYSPGNVNFLTHGAMQSITNHAVVQVADVDTA